MSEDTLKLAQKISHEVWQKYDDQFGYRSEKQELNAREHLTKHPDNIWFFWGQFDADNHIEFLTRVVEIPTSPAQQELLEFVTAEIDRERSAVRELAEKEIFL